MDTIFALATAQGKAGVAVVRISGPAARLAVSKLGGTLPEPRGAVLRRLRDSKGAFLDDALVLRFDAPASFTGEDVVELHLHGSTAVVSAVLAELSGNAALRLAEPGEFTRRALENGKMDLLQVEALADLIEAETETQRRQAQASLTGAFGARVDQWRRDLIRAMALIEATIDFADEEVPTDVTPEVRSLLDGVKMSLSGEISGISMAERIRLGFEVAIVGPPNAGKSTLLNALAGRDAAITSDIAGTTRDVIEVRMDLGGIAVTLLDTAGLRRAEDEIEAIGVERALSRAQAADLRVFLRYDGWQPHDLVQYGDIVLDAKDDAGASDRPSVSGRTGEGIDQLIAMISDEIANRASKSGLATRERHRIAMVSASIDLDVVFETLDAGPEMYDISAEHLRRAIRSLEALIGRVDVENYLDEIFSSFCLGK